MSDVVIHDGNWRDYVDPVVDGERKLCRTFSRDYGLIPHGSLAFAKPFDLVLIPESEWQSRLDDMVANRSRLSDIRDAGMDGSPIPSRDQDGKGYCWAHSSVSACLALRAVNNLPYADLSAFAVACIIKGYRDQGGWGAESLEWIAANGVPTGDFWPQKSMSRSNDTPAMRANAATNKVEEWMDLDPQQVKAQLVTCLLSRIPVVVDFNWWSHSVCALDLVSLDPFSIRIWNSWSDAWGENGTGIIQGRRAIPDGAIAPRVVGASAA